MTFKEAIVKNGLCPPDEIPFEKFVRFNKLGGKTKNNSGWCYLFADGKVGVFGDWSMGFKETWRNDELKNYNSQQIKDYNRRVKEVCEKAKKKQEDIYQKVSEKVTQELSLLSDCITHEYLNNKGVNSYGLKLKKDLIIIPFYNSENKITTYQSISEEGDKKFYYGGKKKGSAFPIKGNTDIVFICEGYATGASIHECTGNMVLVTGNDSNVFDIACLAYEKNYQKIIIAADNDDAGIKAGKKVYEKYPEIKYIVPPVSKYDWNDYHKKNGFIDTREVILELISQYRKTTASDIINDSKSTPLTQELFSDGLFKMGMQAAEELSAIKINQYNFPSVFVLIASVLAGKIKHRNVHTSCFFIRVGPTSTGKTETDKEFKRLLRPYFTTPVTKTDGSPTEMVNALYGATDFVSGPALYRSVQQKSRCLFDLDEITGLFSGTMDSLALGKRSALLELSTAAGERIERSYSDSAKTLIIEDSCINMIGNATSLIFSAFSLDDLQSGLLQRFDFFCYDGKIPYRESYPNRDSLAAKEFAERLLEISEIKKPDGIYDITTDEAVDIGITKDALELTNLYSKQIIDECNDEENEGIRGIISRKYDSATKFALIHVGATRPVERLFQPLDVGNILYGQRLAETLGKWKIDILVNNIHAGDFDIYVKLFIEGAKSAVQVGKKPTGKMIVCRRPKLKNLKPREFDDVVRICRARRLIQVREDGGRTLYEPIQLN